MSKVFEKLMTDLEEASGYAYHFLCEKYHEIWEEEGDVDVAYFIGVSMERDWTVRDLFDLRLDQRPIYSQCGERDWMRLANPQNITPFLTSICGG